MDTLQIWCMYFGAIMSWQQHPGYFLRPEQKMKMEDCAALADLMLEYTVNRRHLWEPSSVPLPPE